MGVYAILFLGENEKAKKNPAADKEMQLEIIRPLRSQEIAVSAEESWKEFVERREDNFHDKHKIGIKLQLLMGFYCDKRYQSDDGTDVYKLFPGKVFLLNFNYTTYIESNFRNMSELFVGSCEQEHIHGDLNDENSIIFGYGDDSGEMYKRLSDKNDNRFLENDKTVKYLGSARYRNFLGFIESAPFQVCIMGHSCGVSALQNMKLDTAGIRSLFDVVVVSGDIGIYKPDRRIFDEAARRAGVQNSECLFVGDHPVNDVQGALGAGMNVIRMNYGDFKGKGLGKEGVFAEIEDIRDVLNYI